MKHIKQLAAAAASGDQLAASQLAAALWVPHHNRPARGLLRFASKGFRQGVHVTAKTLKAVKCLDSVTVPSDYGLDRLQMLKERRA